MLRELHIENVAVIEKADISFGPGLNVLTGETGAGKSIIIDSIGAVIGDRVNHSLVRTGAEKASVTAVFDIGEAKAWLDDNEIDYDDELIIQRRINAEGKSSCRVCGSPVTANQLRELSSALIDIHGQNDGRQLLDEKNHLLYLDAFAELAQEREAYKAQYSRLNKLLAEIKNFTADLAEKEARVDIIRYKVDELTKANVQPGEKDEISDKLSVLRNFEKISENSGSAYAALYADDDNAASLIENAVYDLSKAGSYSEKLRLLSERLNGVSIELEDIIAQLREYRDSIDFSEEEYNFLEGRLSQINRLERKYLCLSDELPALCDKLRAELESVECSDEVLAAKQKEADELLKECKKQAASLSRQRKAKAKLLEEQILKELRELNMPSVRFEVRFEPVGTKNGLDSSGCDAICFVMSANRGAALDKINKIASGGELSRIMLAMKNVFASRETIATMIFDEIDTGVSGIAAQSVACKLLDVSEGKQVICITHLPQIAAMADNHYRILKSESTDKTYTEVNLLNGEGREAELARLYGGSNITDTTLAAAREQIEADVRYKNSKTIV